MSHPTGSNLRPLVVPLQCSGWYSPGPSGFKPVDLISTVFLIQWLPTIQLLIWTVISTSCMLLSLCYEEFCCLLSMYLETTSYQGRAISPTFALGSERSKPHSQVIVGKPAHKTTDNTHLWFITLGYDGTHCYAVFTLYISSNVSSSTSTVVTVSSTSPKTIFRCWSYA